MVVGDCLIMCKTVYSKFALDSMDKDRMNDICLFEYKDEDKKDECRISLSVKWGKMKLIRTIVL